MQRASVQFRRSFGVVIDHPRSQAAEMTLQPGKSEGGPDNRHRGSDQWLFVLSGNGVARINGHSYPLKRNTVVLIERGDLHEILCTGRTPLKTINFYVPPAYDAEGEELPAGKR